MATTVLLVTVLVLVLVGALAALGVALVGRVTRATREATREEVDRALANGAREADIRDDAFAHHLVEMARRLEGVTESVGKLREDRAGQQGELMERMGEAQRATEVLRSTTEGLQRALSNPQARGQWGERMADDVLRACGFVEGINYAKQQTLPDGSRPDVTFFLPDDRLQHMDVKFPLAGYQRWCAAGTDDERAKAVVTFRRDVRERIKELAKPGYLDERTPGFVLLFIPVEAVYGFIHEHDPGLVDEALSRKVVLCSPFTLFAVLGVIRQAADSVAFQRNADEVVTLLTGFRKQWDEFTGKLEVLGKQLQTVQTTYEAVNGPRRRQLERQLDRVEDVRQRRGLPAGDAGSDEPVLREVSSW
jgi:DNA recombination protein RmuC